MVIKLHFRRYFTILLLLICSISLSAQKWGLVKTSVTSLRTAPRHAAEMCTQAIMGTPIKLLQKSDSWWHVELPDGYRGYLPANTIVTLSDTEFDKWRRCTRMFLTEELEGTLYTPSMEEGSESDEIVTDLLIGNLLEVNLSTNTGELIVCTPDGRNGSGTSIDYMSKEIFPSEFKTQFDADKIVDTAKQMLGRVYLWGGTSARMVDCSGLVKVCYLSCGIILRRDASQQAKTGMTIANIKEARKGDLLFFGNQSGKVNHVGIYIGDNKFIHSSGMVKINSLDPKDDDYTKLNLLKIKRIDGMIGTDGIWAIEEHPWYVDNNFNYNNEQDIFD